jgi:hypothetical protein
LKEEKKQRKGMKGKERFTCLEGSKEGRKDGRKEGRKEGRKGCIECPQP